MNFLAPFFLLGGLALAAPVIFHLIRRTTRERTTFSSLMFLRPSPPRLSRRSRLEHWLLLLLRCLALALLALGFARPFFKQSPVVDPTSVQPKRTVVLVDVSASMRRAGLWSAARERVNTAVRRAAPGDQVAVLTFDRRVTPLVSFEDWNRVPPADRAGLVAARIDSVSPGWSGTHLGSALITAAETLAEPDEKKATLGPREIVLVSDVQAGSRLDALQAYEWPKGVVLVVEPIKARSNANAGVQLIAESAEAVAGSSVAVRVRVTNASDSPREQFKVGWLRPENAEFAGPPIDLYVPPGQSRVLAVPLPKGATGLTRIGLRGDDEDFDNTVFVIPPAQQKLGVLWLGSELADDTTQPLFFLRRALTDSPRLAVKVVAHGLSAPLLPTETAAATIIFVSEAVAPAQAAALRAEVVNGKTIVFAPKSAAAAPTLAALLGRDSVPIEEARVANYAMFAEIDFRHPLFAAFADPRFSDFTKIHFWKYRKFDAGTLPDAHVVAKFDSGDPAVIDVPVGRGRIVVLAAGWQPDDSQLAVSSKFVPLTYSLLELAGGAPDAAAQWIVGDALPVPAGRDAVTLRTPAAKTITLPMGATSFADTDEPGIYEIIADGRVLRLPVNLDPAESRTAPLGTDELEHLGVPVTAASLAPAAAAADPKLLAGAETENRQKLWRWFIAATLAVLLIETALAGRAARRAHPKLEEAPS